MNVETITRPITWEPERRDGTSSRRIVGYAAVFGVEGDRLPFRERIARGAFAAAIQKRGTTLNFAHDDRMLLATQGSGTLELSEDERGLRVAATLVNTSVGNDVLELVRAGLAPDMSFAFIPSRERWDGDVRVIEEVSDLFDVTICPVGAYSATSVEARQALDVDAELERVRARRAGRGPVRTRSSYGPDSEHSFFQDLATVAYDDADRDRLLGEPRLPSVFPSFARSQEGPAEARKRLAAEQRDMSSTGSFGAVMGQGLPAFLAERYGRAVHAGSPFWDALPKKPLESGSGLTHQAFRFTNAATAGTSYPENAAAGVPMTDLTTETFESKVTYLSAGVNAAQQLLDLSFNGAFDLIVADELGRAIGERLDVELFSGTGLNGRMLGLFGAPLAGTINVACTAATFAGQYGDVHEAGGSVMPVQRGAGPDIMVVHPRRAAFWDVAGTVPSVTWPARRIVSNAVPLGDAGGGTNDIVTLVRLEDVVAEEAPLRTLVKFDHAGSGQLTAKILAVQPSNVVWLQPKGIATLRGVGLTAPSLGS